MSICCMHIVINAKHTRIGAHPYEHFLEPKRILSPCEQQNESREEKKNVQIKMKITNYHRFTMEMNNVEKAIQRTFTRRI